MSFFKDRKTKENTVIIGCGKLGASLATSLSENGGSVVVIDKSEDSFRKLGSSFTGLIFVGDGTDLEMLQQVQIEEADVVLVVTDNDNTNVMISQIARQIFHVPHVIARLYDSERECVYRQLNIEIICPNALSVKEIDKVLHFARNHRFENEAVL